MEVSFKQVHQQVLATVEQQARSRAVRAANVMKKYSDKVLSNSPQRTGKVYRKPFAKTGTYVASAPGEPPAMRPGSGTLRKSWEPLPIEEISQGGKVYTAGIHTDVKYAPWLQHGTSKMAPRPFEEKIKSEAQQEVNQIWNQPYLK